MEKKWRLIADGKNDGYYNMAVDEALFSCYADQKKPTLRIYGWSKPCISLGYNQNFDKVLKTGIEMPVVRRITGGASILHDDEITYSLVCASRDLNLPFKVKDSYKILCSFLINFYKKLGLKAQFAQDILPENNLGRYGNFCFSAYEHFDLIINNKKIGGNAQARRKDVIFQHGSIPLSVNFDMVRNLINDAIDLEDNITFLNALVDKKLDFNTITTLLSESFKYAFDIDLACENLSQKEVAKSSELAENKYKLKQWNVDKSR